MMILLFRVSFLPNPPPLRFMYKSNTTSSSHAYYDTSLTFLKHKMEINRVIASYLLICTDVRKKGSLRIILVYDLSLYQRENIHILYLGSATMMSKIVGKVLNLQSLIIVLMFPNMHMNMTFVVKENRCR